MNRASEKLAAFQRLADQLRTAAIEFCGCSIAEWLAKPAVTRANILRLLATQAASVLIEAEEKTIQRMLEFAAQDLDKADGT